MRRLSDSTSLLKILEVQAAFEEEGEKAEERLAVADEDEDILPQ